jgi:hypothetical protein
MAFKIILTILSLKILIANGDKTVLLERVKNEEFFGVMVTGYNHD